MSESTLLLLSHPAFPQVFKAAIQQEVISVSALFCTQLDEGGYECGDPAVIQFLPDGDEAACAKHLRRRQLIAALREVERG